MTDTPAAQTWHFVELPGGRCGLAGPAGTWEVTTGRAAERLAAILNALEAKLAASERTIQEKHDLWLDAINHGVEMERQLTEATAALEEEAAFCEAQAETPSDEGLTPLQNQIFEDIHLTFAGRLRDTLSRLKQHETEVGG